MAMLVYQRVSSLSPMNSVLATEHVTRVWVVGKMNVSLLHRWDMDSFPGGYYSPLARWVMTEAMGKWAPRDTPLAVTSRL